MTEASTEDKSELSENLYSSVMSSWEWSSKSEQQFSVLQHVEAVQGHSKSFLTLEG